VVTTKGPTLTCTDILGVVSETPALDLRSVSKCAMKQAERARIAQALRDSHGNRAQAAKSLKISRAGLYNKLREYDLT
jgi:two-component system response regulator AtoC